jgi:two-component system sensor histidine kinase MtrB
LRARLDPRRFDVIVANLVGNALRHGGGTATVSARSEAGAGGPQLVLEVADRGPGIDPEALPHIFERFYKADRTRTSGGGTGLGLAIARHIVEGHGGAIRVDSEEGRGATFAFTIPISDAAHVPASVAGGSAAAQTGGVAGG